MEFLSALNSTSVVARFLGAMSCAGAHIPGLVFTPTYCTRDIWLANSFYVSASLRGAILSFWSVVNVPFGVRRMDTPFNDVDVSGNVVLGFLSNVRDASSSSQRNYTVPNLMK